MCVKYHRLWHVATSQIEMDITVSGGGVDEEVTVNEIYGVQEVRDGK